MYFAFMLDTGQEHKEITLEGAKHAKAALRM